MKMLPSKGPFTRHKLTGLDIRIMSLASEVGSFGLSVGDVSLASGSGEMLCWNSIRKLRRVRLVYTPESATRLGRLTPYGSSSLAFIRRQQADATTGLFSLALSAKR